MKSEMYRLRAATTFVLKLSLCVVWVAACKPESKSTFTDTKAVPKDYVTTFKLRPCEVMIVEGYGKLSDASDNTPPKAIREVRDEATLHQILTLAAALPDEGQIMKKMAGDVPLLRTTLMYADDTIFFDYYNTSVKTPSTSFYANPPQEEKALYELLQSLIK